MTLTTEQLAKIKAGIAARKAMPKHDGSIEVSLDRGQVIHRTQDVFSTVTVEMLVNALDELLANRESQPVEWSGWACQFPGHMPRLYGDRAIAEVNCDYDGGMRLLFLSSAPPAPVNALPVAWEMRYWNSGYNMWHDWERITAEQHAEMSVQHAEDNDYEFRVLYDAPPAPAAVKLPTEFYSDEGIVVRLEEVMAALAVVGVQYERKANAKTRCEFPSSEVPEEMTGGIAMSKYKVKKSNYAQWVKGWNACRAAMLAAAPEGGN